MCEIDSMVCDVSKRFFPDNVATAFGDARVTLVHADAAVFVKAEGHATYDVIIVDSSDPVGPAEALFEQSFYANMKAALNPGGVICCQGECMWLHLDLITKVWLFDPSAGRRSTI
jgi:spermidine synthase